jgi:hypothetical protein
MLGTVQWRLCNESSNVVTAVVVVIVIAIENVPSHRAAS